MSYPAEFAPGAHPELTRGAHPRISPWDLTRALTRDHPWSSPGEVSLYARQVSHPGSLHWAGLHLGSQPAELTGELTKELTRKHTRNAHPVSSLVELIRRAHPGSSSEELTPRVHS